MNSIGAYNAYQADYGTRNVKGKGRNRTDKTDRRDKTGKKDDAVNGLSEKAQRLLKELQKKYRNMDFIVASYETDEEAEELLSRGNKEYSVLIDPEELEKMAADESVKEKNMAIIEESVSGLRSMREQLGDDGREVVRMGVSIGKDGTVSYFADLEKLSERQRERIENARAEKREEEAEAEKAQYSHRGHHGIISSEKNQTTRVEADSIEGLMEAIRGVDWSVISPEEVQESGGKFDLSI